VNRILYLAATVLLISACSEKQPEATPPELNTPEVKHTEEKPLKEKLSQVMQRETLGMNVSYLEGITGPAMYISDDGKERTYKIEGCDFQIKTLKKQNHESVNSIRLGVSPECDVDISGFFGVSAEDKFPTLNNLTFGEFIEKNGGFFQFYSYCLMDCGNAYDPSVYGYWEGSRALNFINVSLEAVRVSDEAINASSKWRDYMIKHIGEEWVRDGKFNCDPLKYSSEASDFFSSIHPSSIRIGYDIEFDKSFYCKEEALAGNSNSTTKQVEQKSNKADEYDIAAWKKIKDQVESNPTKYVNDCVESFVSIAKDKGGLSRKEALRGGLLEEDCKGEVAILKDCARRMDGADLECYMQFIGNLELQ